MEIDDFVLPVAGTYTIRVFEGGNDATGSFSIGVSDQPIQTPHPLPAFNTAISGALELLGDVDDYTFDGDAGQIVTVERLSSNFDLTLFDASGAVIAGGGDADALLDLITLPVDGSYTIRVEPSGGSLSSALDDVGAYSFTVWTPNRTPEATAIGFGQSLPGQIAIRGDIVEYELSVTAAEVGQPVSIVHSAVPDASTAYYASQLQLYAPDGSLLESRSGSYYTHALEIDDFVLPVAGTYTIRVLRRWQRRHR